MSGSWRRWRFEILSSSSFLDLKAAPSSLTILRDLALTSAFCSGVDRVANCAPRSKVTFFDVEASLSSEMAMMDCFRSSRSGEASLSSDVTVMSELSGSNMDMLRNLTHVAASMPRSSGRRLLMSP